jgi:hypothetical protein
MARAITVMMLFRSSLRVKKMKFYSLFWLCKSSHDGLELLLATQNHMLPTLFTHFSSWRMDLVSHAHLSACTRSLAQWLATHWTARILKSQNGTPLWRVALCWYRRWDGPLWRVALCWYRRWDGPLWHVALCWYRRWDGPIVRPRSPIEFQSIKLNATMQGPSSEAEIRSSGQENPSFFDVQKFVTAFKLSQLHTVRSSTTSYFSKTNF